MTSICTDGTYWTMSPRVSFSYDLPQGGNTPVECKRSDSSILDSPEFKFFVDGIKEESSPADELISDGRILPISPHRVCKEDSRSRSQNAIPALRLPLPLPSAAHTVSPEPKSLTTPESLGQMLALPHSDSEEKSQPSKSFWRSSSLNRLTEHTHSLISKLPLLNRSHSTGSTNGNKKRPEKVDQKKTPEPPRSSTVSVSSRKSIPAKKRNQRSRARGYGTEVRINPVLNIPHPYISPGTANLFGFGSLFRTGRDTGNNRKHSRA